MCDAGDLLIVFYDDSFVEGFQFHDFEGALIKISEPVDSVAQVMEDVFPSADLQNLHGLSQDVLALVPACPFLHHVPDGLRQFIVFKPFE
jgi:hypothetical protein